MKNVVISADGDRMVYSVPDEVANNLRKYCMVFCNKWIWEDPRAEKYRHADEDGGSYVSYCEVDFIEYLNTWMFPDQKSVLVENLGWIDFGSELPAPYASCPTFNF